MKERLLSTLRLRVSGNVRPFPVSRRTLETVLEVAVPVGVVTLWALLSTNSGAIYFPPLTEILREFAETWVFERVGSDVLPSLSRLGAGYAIAVLIGIGAGIPLGLSTTARRAATPIIDFLRALPPPAIIPFAVVVIGVGSTMKIFVISFACVWFILLNTIDGVRGIEPGLLDTARAYGVKGRDRLRYVVVPAASPQIFAGMRTALSVSLIVMVISEMTASTNGIGFFVLQAQRQFAITEMWSGIVLLALLGYTLNLMFILIERRVLAWHHGAKASALS